MPSLLLIFITALWGKSYSDPYLIEVCISQMPITGCSSENCVGGDGCNSGTCYGAFCDCSPLTASCSHFN